MAEACDDQSHVAQTKPIKLPPVDTEVTAVKIVNLYDEFAPAVLTPAFLLRLPRAKKQRQAFKVVAELPQPTEYAKIRDSRHTVTAESLVDEAYSLIEELSEEMGAWRDNMPEGLQSSDRGERVSSAADELESISNDKPAWPDDGIGSVTTLFRPGKRETRSDRANEAASMLKAAADACDPSNEEIKEMIPQECSECSGTGVVSCGECGAEKPCDVEGCNDGKVTTERTLDGVEEDDVQSFVDELTEAAQALEGIEFPSMYG